MSLLKILNLLSISLKREQEKGFSLIELLIVIFMLSFLTALSLPNLLKQIGKAREVEAKNGIAAIHRSQQAYHFERGDFAASITDLDLPTLDLTIKSQNNVTNNDPLGITISSKYYSFAITTIQSENRFADYGLVVAQATDPDDHGTRHYAGGIGYFEGEYEQVLCQSEYGQNTTITTWIDVTNHFFINLSSGDIACQSGEGLY